MSIQDILVAGIVLAAAGYLVWKVTLAKGVSRRKSIDVPTNRLLRKLPRRGCPPGGCH